MPVYRCMVSEGRTSFEQRSRIARAVTGIHCAVTGAPATFVHVLFAEDAGAALAEGTQAVVLGSIRAGRSREQKERLVGEIRSAIAAILACAEGEVTVATVDVPARWIMEGGAVLPEPGDEEAWLARHG